MLVRCFPTTAPVNRRIAASSPPSFQGRSTQLRNIEATERHAWKRTSSRIRGAAVKAAAIRSRGAATRQKRWLRSKDRRNTDWRLVWWYGVIFDCPVFDHWECSIKLGWKRDGIREGTNIGTQLLFGIETTNSPGDLL